MRLSILCVLLGQVMIAVGQFYFGPFLIEDTGILGTFLPARRVGTDRYFNNNLVGGYFPVTNIVSL